LKLPTPCAPFSRITHVGESVSIDPEGKVLVLPSGNPDIFPQFNEYTLNSNRLNISESTWGGVKGSVVPDFMPGTINIIEGDGVYLQDIDGQNSSKILSAGKLSELGLLSVDTEVHSITDEFIVRNTATDNNPIVITNCDSITSWSGGSNGTATINTTDKQEGHGCVQNTCHTAGDLGTVYDPLGSWDFFQKQFLTLWVKGVSGKTIRTILQTGANYISWDVTANGSWQKLVLPLKKPKSSVGTLELTVIEYLVVYLSSADIGDMLLLDNITVDVARPAYLEIQVPDYLADTSAQIYTHDGTAYQLCRTCKLDPTYVNVSNTDENCMLADSTKLSDVYGTGNGRSIFPRGESGQIKSGSLIGSQITYSENKGTLKRIGLRVDLPPTSTAVPDFSAVRFKIVIYYAQDLSSKYSTTYQFSDDKSASTGLQHMIKPWIILYDPESIEIDFYMYTYRPKVFEFQKDENGTIYKFTMYSGNGNLYYGRIIHFNPSLDSNKNLIPDFLEPDSNGSVQKFLAPYTFMGEWFIEYDLSESVIMTNDFWITVNDLDIIPFAVSEGDTVFTTDNVFLPIVDTVSTATGNVSIVDVKGQAAVRVKDTAYIHTGECKVWDTVTHENITESTWERVYGTDHLFTGDCVLDNGIIRLITYANDEFYRIGLLYLYTNNNWVFIKEIRARTYPTVYALNSISATVISPEKVEILGQTSAYSRYLAISKGSFSLEIYGGQGSEILFEGDPEISDSRFLYWGNLRDVYADIHEDGDWYQSDNHYLALINPESSFIWYVSSSISPEYYGLTTPELVDAVHIVPNTEELKGYIGAVPYDCSKLFYEAESMTVLSTGEQPYNEGFIGISLTLVNDGVKCSNILEPGTYKVYARVKSSLNESNGGRFHIYYTPEIVNILNNSVPTSGTTEYLSATFTIPQEAVGYPISISFIKHTNSANQLDIDYLLIVPTELIEKHVKRVLYQLSPMTKQLKYSYDVSKKVTPDVHNHTVNLLNNPSFESGETVSPGWSYENYAKGTPIYSKSTTTGVVNGSVAQQISYTGVEEDGEYSAVVCYQAPVYVTGGYRVDFYIYVCGTLENCKLVYGIESKDINSESISYVERTFKSLPNNPTQILISYVCPENAYFLVAYLKFEDLVSPSSSFTAYIDDAKLLSEDGCVPWCGINWRAQMGTDLAPADNNWSRLPSNVWVDEDDKLHMTVKNDNGKWNCTELRSSPILFGKFTWTIESPIFNLDKNAIFGLFLYTDDTHEIDIEISRWTADQNDLILYSVQPSEVEGNSTGYIPSVTVDGVTTAESGYDGSNLTCQIDWQPDYIDWKAWDNNGDLIAEKHYTDATQIPQIALELRMNLWLKHAIPVDGNDIEIVITHFDVD
jgi:hypothetical protein